MVVFSTLRKKENNEIDIYLKITVDSTFVQLSTKRKCFKANWNVKAGRAEGKTEYAKSIQQLFRYTLTKSV